jgi:hypothetical protein
VLGLVVVLCWVVGGGGGGGGAGGAWCSGAADRARMDRKSLATQAAWLCVRGQAIGRALGQLTFAIDPNLTSNDVHKDAVQSVLASLLCTFTLMCSLVVATLAIVDRTVIHDIDFQNRSLHYFATMEPCGVGWSSFVPFKSVEFRNNEVTCDSNSLPPHEMDRFRRCIPLSLEAGFEGFDGSCVIFRWFSTLVVEAFFSGFSVSALRLF